MLHPRIGEDSRTTEHGYGRIVCDALAEVSGRGNGCANLGKQTHSAILATGEKVLIRYGESGSLENDGPI